MTLIENLRNYLAEVIGREPQIQETGEKYKETLPLFLSALYRIHAVDLFGRHIILAVQKSGKEEWTPAEYEGHLNQLQNVLGNDTALVLPNVPSYVRNRLIQKGIPFIDPCRHMFLPMFLIDLRERFPRQRTRRTECMSWAAQAVALYHILKKPAPGMSLRQLAEKTGYSPMTISNVAEEFAGISACNISANGKSRQISFTIQGKELWNAMAPKLRAPDIRIRYVKTPKPIARAVPAGLTALAHLTLISDDPVPTVALRDSEYRRLIETGEIKTCHSRQDADNVVECWGYDPNLLSDGRTVDKLSLYLSLKGEPDERIRKELQIMMENIQW